MRRQERSCSSTSRSRWSRHNSTSGQSRSADPSHDGSVYYQSSSSRCEVIPYCILRCLEELDTEDDLPMRREDGMDQRSFTSSRTSVQNRAQPSQCRPSRSIQRNAGLTLVTSSYNVPDPQKAERGGEDGLFTTANAIGVFDGVSGTMESGIDSGKFAKRLAKLVKRCMASWNPASILNDIRSSVNQVQLDGMSTLCVAALRGNMLATINVGDSRVIVVRGGRVIHATKAQSKFFNSPYAVCCDKTVSDFEAADVVNLEIMPGDMLVMATDGLWDNVYTEAVLDILARNPCPARPESDAVLARLAHRMASLVTMKAIDAASSIEPTPFEEEALVEGAQWTGGKKDDITVIVGVVALET